MSKIPPSILIPALLALASTDIQEQTVHINHKEIVKRQKPIKVAKRGRGKPAKGYDPITKTWVRP
jgi:hypothetical protein